MGRSLCLREMFALYDPDQVSNWVVGLEAKLKNSRPLTITVFLKALELLKGKIPDALAASTIASECREKLGAKSVKNAEVVAIDSGAFHRCS
jgi:hypothetical protein